MSFFARVVLALIEGQTLGVYCLVVPSMVARTVRDPMAGAFPPSVAPRSSRTIRDGARYFSSQ
jgi:hypothetical protein